MMPVVEYAGPSLDGPMFYGEHYRVFGELPHGQTYKGHTAISDHLILDDIGMDGTIMGRYIVGKRRTKPVDGRCLCPACSQ